MAASQPSEEVEREKKCIYKGIKEGSKRLERLVILFLTICSLGKNESTSLDPTYTLKTNINLFMRVELNDLIILPRPHLMIEPRLTFYLGSSYLCFLTAGMTGLPHHMHENIPSLLSGVGIKPKPLVMLGSSPGPRPSCLEVLQPQHTILGMCHFQTNPDQIISH